MSLPSAIAATKEGVLVSRGDSGKNTCHLAATRLQERKLTMRKTQDTGPRQLRRISKGSLG